MSSSDQDTGLGQLPQPDRILDDKQTVPFVGLTPDGSSGHQYPDYIDPSTRRFDPDAESFKAVIEALPNAGSGSLFTQNKFLDVDGDDISIDLEAIRDVHGLDQDAVKRATGQSLEALAENADVTIFDQVDNYQNVVDERRWALHTLGFDVGSYSWQVASDSYTAGDMQAFFRQKIAACKERNIDNVFGWVRYRDWGGDVDITTFYPELVFTLSLPDDITIESGELAVDADGGDILEMQDSDGAADDTDAIRVIYGEKAGYGYRGMQTIHATPFLYFPESTITLPIPSRKDLSFNRRHEGNFMDVDHENENDRTSPLEWHDEIISHLDALSDEINPNIVRSRLVSLSFDELPFSTEAFYEYLGIPTTYASDAADRVATLEAEANSPSLWTLQFALKVELAESFQGSKVGDRYHELVEIAGRILQHPVEEINVALRQYKLDQDSGDDSDEDNIDEEQQTLVQSLDELLDMDGVGEETISLRESQELDRMVQANLDSVQAKAKS